MMHVVHLVHRLDALLEVAHDPDLLRLRLEARRDEPIGLEQHRAEPLLDGHDLVERREGAERGRAGARLEQLGNVLCSVFATRTRGPYPGRQEGRGGPFR